MNVFLVSSSVMEQMKKKCDEKFFFFFFWCKTVYGLLPRLYCERGHCIVTQWGWKVASLKRSCIARLECIVT